MPLLLVLLHDLVERGFKVVLIGGGGSSSNSLLGFGGCLGQRRRYTRLSLRQIDLLDLLGLSPSS